MRQATDGEAFLLGSPEVLKLVATGLAERLNFVQTYLTDLRRQYGDAPGLAMIPEVIGRLAQGEAPRAVPGSRRDPGPEY